MHLTPSNSLYLIFILILSFQVVSFIPVQRLKFYVHFSSQTLDNVDENTNYVVFFSGKKVVKPNRGAVRSRNMQLSCSSAAGGTWTVDCTLSDSGGVELNIPFSRWDAV